MNRYLDLVDVKTLLDGHEWVKPAINPHGYPPVLQAPTCVIRSRITDSPDPADDDPLVFAPSPPPPPAMTGGRPSASAASSPLSRSTAGLRPPRGRSG